MTTTITKTTYPKTLAFGEEIILSGGESDDMRITRTTWTDEEGTVELYQLDERIGEEWSFVSALDANAAGLAETIRDGQRMINGGYNTFIVELLSDDCYRSEKPVYGEGEADKILQRADVLGDRHTKKAQLELEKIHAEVKARLGVA